MKCDNKKYNECKISEEDLKGVNGGAFTGSGTFTGKECPQCHKMTLTCVMEDFIVISADCSDCGYHGEK